MDIYGKSYPPGCEIPQSFKDCPLTTAKQILNYLKNRKLTTILDDLYWGKTFHKSSQKFQIWQDGYHPEEISTREMMIQKLTYLHNNPIKRGYVRKAEDWRFSSIGRYLGWDNELLDVCCTW